MWMGVSFRDGPDKRCKERYYQFFCSSVCRVCFKLPYLCCINDQKNVFKQILDCEFGSSIPFRAILESDL